MAMRNVISTLNHDGTEVMGPGILMYHYPGNDIMNGSLLTVESNHFCVLKSRGAVLNVYETGQYPVQTPQRPLLGSIQQSFYGGQSPWQYEARVQTPCVREPEGMADSVPDKLRGLLASDVYTEKGRQRSDDALPEPASGDSKRGPIGS